MDITYEKKRRNIMVTAVAVTTASFLGLGSPGLLSASLYADPRIEPWRIWALVVMVLIYQAWRIATDAGIGPRIAEAKEYYSRAKTDLNYRHIYDHAVRTVKRKAAGEQIDDLPDLDLPTKPICWRQSGISPALRDEIGQPTEIDWDGSRKPIQMNYTLFSNDGSEYVTGSSSIQYDAKMSFIALRNVRAAFRMCLRSPDAQDLLIPIVLAAAAFCIAMYRLVDGILACGVDSICVIT